MGSKPQYKIGDIIACFADKRHIDDITMPPHYVIGWVEKISDYNKHYTYYVRWADRVSDGTELMPVEEEQMAPLIRLVEAIRAGELPTSMP